MTEFVGRICKIYRDSLSIEEWSWNSKGEILIPEVGQDKTRREYEKPWRLVQILGFDTDSKIYSESFQWPIFMKI